MWVFIGRTDVEAETPKLWPLGVGNWMVGGKTTHLVSGEIDSPRLSLPCDVRVQVSLGRGV